MKTIEEITTGYVTSYKKYDGLNDKIREKEKQIERLKNRREKISFRWTQDILKPIVQEVEKHLPELEFCKDERYTPMGLCSRVSIFPKYKGETLMVNFIPLDLTKGEIGFETGVQETYYPKGSIGEVNGMGREYKAIVSVQQVVDFLKGQMKEIDNP